MGSNGFHVVCFENYQKKAERMWVRKEKKMEERGIDPLTSRMLSERSTI